MSNKLNGDGDSGDLIELNTASCMDTYILFRSISCSLLMVAVVNNALRTASKKFNKQYTIQENIEMNINCWIMNEIS